MTSATLTRLFLVFFAILPLAADSPGKIVLVAGGGEGGDESPALQAKLNSPFGVDFDTNGNLYFVEMLGNRVRKIDPKGILTTIAGNGKKGFSGDGGPAKDALVDGPHSLAVAKNGDIYISDTYNNRVRKIDAKTGVISTVVGTGEKGFSGDGGPATQAKFGNIYCVAFDPKREHLYMADLDNRRIRVLDMGTGIVRTVAGNGKKGVPQNGALAVEQPLVDPRAVAAEKEGNVYILERSGNALRAIMGSGNAPGPILKRGRIWTPNWFYDELAGKRDALKGPKHLCMDLEGNILIADTENHRIVFYHNPNPPKGSIAANVEARTIAGTGKKGMAGLGGPPEKAELNQPHGVYVHPNGDIYIADSSNNRILKIVHGK